MTIEKRKEKLTYREALLKTANFCAYQERCHEEVQQRLFEWGIRGNDAGMIMHELVEQGFLDEERFASAFAGGKFRTKKWGRIKIMLELKAKKVSDYCIREGLKAIDDETYYATLKELCHEKYSSIKILNIPAKKNKTATYLIGKGYEPELVWEELSRYR